MYKVQLYIKYSCVYKVQLYIKYSCPPHILQALVGVKVCLQMFLSLEPDEDECSAAFLLWKAPSVTSGPHSWSGDETL